MKGQVQGWQRGQHTSVGTKGGAQSEWRLRQAVSSLRAHQAATYTASIAPSLLAPSVLVRFVTVALAFATTASA